MLNHEAKGVMSHAAYLCPPQYEVNHNDRTASNERTYQDESFCSVEVTNACH